MEDTKNQTEENCEGIIEEAFSKIKDEKGEKMNFEKLNAKFDEAERGHMKNETEIVKAQLNISANLQPLTKDHNNIKEVQDSTNEELVKESKEYHKKLQNDYKNIRNNFRSIMNKLIYKEYDVFDKIKGQNINVENDPYSDMREEIKRIDEEEKRKGVIRSHSEGYDSHEEGEEKETRIPLGKSSKVNVSASKNVNRRGSLVRKNNSKKRLPFRSSAGFSKKGQKQDMVGRGSQRVMRVGSARWNKLPPQKKMKEGLNQLKELKINEEKDKIMDEFNKIVSKTSTSFKEPLFPKSSRKKVLQPIRTYSKGSKVTSETNSGPTALKNITKFNKPGMLAAQNEAIASILSKNN